MSPGTPDQVVLTRGSDSVVLELNMGLSAPIVRHAAQDVLAEGVRGAAAHADRGGRRGHRHGVGAEVPTLSLDRCILVPTLRMRGSPPASSGAATLVRFPGRRWRDACSRLVTPPPPPRVTCRALSLARAGYDRARYLSEAVPAW